ncbi:hypothetical protein LAZ67_4001924 [Cordylochernes scorpioides]|uniref:Uncharacterized protein n=1 Tax=Cordylochernes scorpioides TaxID=51811 RepID=A0ABY6KCC8_9ARAC|nr:hypothetical protein LAZ67_4001924 [Cordylochernes scorpioides]
MATLTTPLKGSTHVALQRDRQPQFNLPPSVISLTRPNTVKRKIFWIDMDFDIDILIRNYPICLRNQPLINDQPLQIVPLPSKPWIKLGI